MGSNDESQVRVGAFPNAPTTLADYLAIVRRRKWIVVALPLMAAFVAYAISKTEPHRYQAQATVLLNRASVITAVTNAQDPTAFDSTRFLATQAAIARSPGLAARVVEAAGIPGMSPGALLGASSVNPQASADVLTFSVKSSSASNAVTLANTYAREFGRFKAELDTARINSALGELRDRMKALEARGKTGTPAYQTLVEYQNQLQTIGRLLLVNNASLLQPAGGAGQISPHPRRDVILGGLLGLVVALGLAFTAEALDRRVRTDDEIERALQLPLLGRVARPPRHLRRRNELAMLGEPLSADAEAFHKLRTSIDFLNEGRGARTIMFTSAVQREGKSTTVANLAVAFVRTGRRVALVDLDIRRPALHSLFHVSADEGISDVVVDPERLESAIQRLTLLPSRPAVVGTLNGRVDTSSSSPNGRSDGERVLHLLTCGATPIPGAEFLQSDRLAAVLEKLGEQFDVVLIDAPPLLAVGDAMALSASVDAMVVITRLGIRRPVLQELSRQLRNCRAASFGFILTGVPDSDRYRYGHAYGYAYGYSTQRQGLFSHLRPAGERPETIEKSD